MSVIQLLHGTDHIIEVPDIHIGNPHNDYGMGFYCTRVDEMAREGEGLQKEHRRFCQQLRL